MSNEDRKLIKKLRFMRTTLKPFLNDEYISILDETEQRLTGKDSSLSLVTKKRSRKISNRLSKSELLQKFLSKGL